MMHQDVGLEGVMSVADLEKMQVDAFLADSVVVAEGKLYVQGAGWDSVLSAVFPFRHSRVGIGVILRVPWTKTNQMHSFSVKVVDPDENKIVLGNAPPGTEVPDGKVRELRGQFNVGRPALLNAGDSQVVPIALNIDGLEFQTPNAYSVVISVDDEEMRRLPLRVRTLMQMPGFGPTQLPIPGA
jgi:hypothetical protein